MELESSSEWIVYVRMCDVLLLEEWFVTFSGGKWKTKKSKEPR